MDLSLYLITDSRGMSDEEFFKRVYDAVKNGVTMVQLREKNADTGEMYRRALRLKEICGEYKIPLIINDRIDIALAANADGVHLGASDMPIAAARRILGRDRLIGATAKTVAAAKTAERDGADYFGIGAFFSTDTKSEALVLTREAVKEVNDAVNIPSVGIGGLDAGNIAVISGTGVSGAAVSAAIMHAENSGEAARRLKEKILGLI